MKKLHLGSGGHILKGWDNLDIKAGQGAIHCDLTKQLPYADASVSHIFSEHFIEHLDEKDGLKLLRQSYRVLIPGGRIRITCPDLRQYVEAYLNWNPSPGDAKLFRNGTQFLNYAMLGEAVNGIKYSSNIRESTDHGHRYLYDAQDLAEKLIKVGFHDVVHEEIGTSLVPEFRGLEKHPDGKVMTLEATK